MSDGRGDADAVPTPPSLSRPLLSLISQSDFKFPWKGESFLFCCCSILPLTHITRIMSVRRVVWDSQQVGKEGLELSCALSDSGPLSLLLLRMGLCISLVALPGNLPELYVMAKLSVLPAPTCPTSQRCLCHSRGSVPTFGHTPTFPAASLRPLAFW